MSRALPPVGWQSIIEHEPQSTVVCAWLNTVVMLKQPGHFTSMKKELGDCTKRLSLCFRFSSEADGWRRSRTMVFLVAMRSWGPAWVFKGPLAARASSWRLGGRRSLSSASSQTKATEALSEAPCVCGGQRSPWGTDLWPAGAPRRPFFELLKLSLQLAGLTTARAALAASSPCRLKFEEMRVLSEAQVSTSSGRVVCLLPR